MSGLQLGFREKWNAVGSLNSSGLKFGHERRKKIADVFTEVFLSLCFCPTYGRREHLPVLNNFFKIAATRAKKETRYIFFELSVVYFQN